MKNASAEAATQKNSFGQYCPCVCLCVFREKGFIPGLWSYFYKILSAQNKF